MSWINVQDYRDNEFLPGVNASGRAQHYCRELEQGHILFFDQPPFAFSKADADFLINQPQTNSKLHKNISYRPEADEMRGFGGDPGDEKRAQQILRHYCEQVTELVATLLAPYAGKVQRDYASFRPLEEEGRDLPLHKRNDLLHIDAFPSRPTRGGRILRVFTNIHPFRKRAWDVGGPFRELAERYADKTDTRLAGLLTKLVRWLRAAGLPLAERSPYDRVMLRLHNLLKEDRAYQAQANPRRVEFPPMSTWLVFTDGLPHAVVSGQFAIEQTFVIPIAALVSPQSSPLRILEC